MMPFDSNGQATINRQAAVTGQTVLAEQVNVPFADTQAMLSQLLLKSGVAPMTGPLNMNGNRVVNVGDATNDGDAVSKSYLEEQLSDIGIDEAYKRIATRTADYMALDTDINTIQRFTVAATLSIAPWADLRDNWTLEVWADGVNVTVDPNLTQTINGALTLVVQSGQRATIYKTAGSTFVSYFSGDSISGPQMQGYLYGLRQTKNATDATNDIDVAIGSAGADTSPYNLMQLNAPITKQIDAAWVVGTNAGGLDTGSVGNNTYYIWLIQRPDTAVVDVLFSLSSTAPTLPTNYTRKRLIGSFIRASGLNGDPSPSLPFGLSISNDVVAWVNFNGSTEVIRAAKNVSSVVRNSAGNYTINFTTPMIDANYAAISSAGAGYGQVTPQAAPTTTAYRIGVWGTAGSFVDAAFVSVVFFR